jgi:hypothetical protein
VKTRRNLHGSFGVIVVFIAKTGTNLRVVWLRTDLVTISMMVDTAVEIIESAEGIAPRQGTLRETLTATPMLFVLLGTATSCLWLRSHLDFIRFRENGIVQRGFVVITITHIASGIEEITLNVFAACVDIRRPCETAERKKRCQWVV